MKLTTIFSLILLTQISQAQADQLLERQWGLINQGQTLLQTNGDLTRQEVQGIPGVDINWVRPNEVQQKLKAQGDEALKREVVVAVIDSGIDLDHPEFKGRIWENPLCADLDEQTRLSRPCHGWNFLKNSADLTDDDGHGTHVAGLIVANHDGQGIQGVTPEQVKVMALKVLSKEVNGFVYDGKIITDIIADALIFAINNGAQVVNMSLGWPKVIHTARMQAAIEEARKRDVLLVVATGNNNKDIPTYPCSSVGVLCVGAIDNQGSITEFSNYSGKVDLLAPGESIISTYPRSLESRTLRIQGYETKRGSSQAAPYVASVAAVLKLLNPDATALEIQAWMLAATKQTQKVGEQKNSKYAALDMREALAKSSLKDFVTADFKELLEIEVSEQGQFFFDLPIVNHLQDQEQLTVKVNFFGNTQEVVLENLTSGARRKIRLEGQITDWSADSHGVLEVEISQDEKSLFQASTSIALSRRVEDVAAHKMTLKGLHPEVISFFGRQQKASRMRRVSHPESTSTTVEWFFQDPRIQNGPKSVTDLLIISKSQHQLTRFTTTKMSQLLSVFKIDMNLDGEKDYLFYGIDEERKNIILLPLSSNGEALYTDYPVFKFPITRFEGLPLKNSMEDFSWIKHRDPTLGQMLVPSFHRQWEMPEEDNTTDLLDRLFPGQMRRLYYLAPRLVDGQVELTIRTLESFDFHQSLRQQRMMRDFDTLSLSTAFTQSSKERQSGKIKMIALMGRESQKKAYLLTFTDTTTWSLTPMHIGVTQLEGNMPQAFRDLESQELTDTMGFMALLNRASARLSILDRPEQGAAVLQVARIVQKTDSWGDPIFNTLGGFEDKDSRVLFLETRYSVYSMVTDRFEQTKIQKLPINRDSSFPGMAFAETMKAVSVKNKDSYSPGLMINSSLIYGDRVYTMVQNEEFNRPLALSFSFPEHCLYLDADTLEGEDSLFLLCRHPDRPLMERAEIIRIPLEQ